MGELKRSTIIFKSLYYYEKMLGLCPFIIHKDTLKMSYLGIIYNLAISVLYSICFILIIECRFELRLPRETTLTITMDALGLLFQYCTVVCSWLTVIFQYNRLKSIFNDFKKVEELAKTLNINVYENRLKKLRNISMRLLIINAFYLAVFLADHYTLSLYKKFQEQASAWIWYNVPKIVLYNVGAIFLELMLVLKHNFRALNKLLRYYFSTKTDEFLFRNFSTTSKAFIKLHKIGQFHESLSDLLEHITSFFSLSILFAIIATFIHSFLDIYAVYQYLTYRRMCEVGDFSIYSLNIIWMMTKFLTLYFICGVPDSVCTEACALTA
uniref:Gustatory receptor n=1 Tax=Chouioia cunea TaxID=1570515 RepID=A0A6B9CPP8_9HYME|nr:gustatory receptor 30 [Chouioia cunea]